MIYDCFPFFNELDLLELRLKILENSVDGHVLVESPVTFSGKPKPLYYEENKGRFEKWQDRIKHVVWVPPEDAANAWVRDHGQRNAILNGLIGVPEDAWIIVSDADEIPNPECFNILEFCWSRMDTKRPIHLAMQMFIYYMNLRYVLDWHFGAIAPLWMVKQLTPTGTRYSQIHCVEILPDAGWHFAYMGGREKVIQKMESFAHFNEPTNLFILNKLKEGIEPVDLGHFRMVKVKPEEVLMKHLAWLTDAGFFQHYFKA